MLAAVALVSLTLGGWQVSFDEEKSTLALAHPGGQVSLHGRLSFTSGGKPWRVVAPRDAVADRLALLDGDGDVQGYVSFRANGERLSLLVYHRTAQSYAGELGFGGDLRFTPDSFACRTQARKGGRVLQLAAGAADSGLNDSLFDPERDRALLLHAPRTRLTSRGAGHFGVELRGRIEAAGEAEWTFALERDYYRSRYVPYYRPINRARCASPPTGWMSWNTYFDRATAADNLAEARIGREHLQPFGMEIWSIESWQDNSDTLPVRDFDNLSLIPSPRKFPDGMKKLADDIRALGFRPGIWIAPFGTGSQAFYEAHKGWFLHDREGKPMDTWNGTYTIDPSQPEALDHLRGLFRTASRDWGYEFFKVDGMSGRTHAYSAHYFERPEVRAAFKDPSCPNPFERCVKALREGIGEDRVLLACQGHFTGPEAAYADAARTGADIVHPNEPPKWENLLSQARCTLNQVFAHNIAFYADPDTLLVGDYLGLEQARLATTVVALPGQMMFSADKLARLAPERMRLLQQALPVCSVRPLDLFPTFDMLPVWDLKVRRPFGDWDVVALFNWAPKDAVIGFDFAELGLSETGKYAVYEFWTRAFQGVRTGRFSMPVPGHGVRLLAVHRAQPNPQFLSSDRHVTQGAVELTRLAWDAASRTLTGFVKAVRSSPITLRFLTPPGFTFRSAVAEAGASARASADSAGVVSVTLTSAVSQDVPFRLTWAQAASAAAPAPLAPPAPRPTPPTRDPRSPGYAPAIELADGAVPPPDEDGHFILGPTHAPAPETLPRDDAPKGKVHEFVLTSADSRVYPTGIARDPGTFGTPDPTDPAKLVVSTSRPAPWTRTISVFVPSQYVSGTAAPFIVVADGPNPLLFATLENLIALGRIPVVVGIAVGNGGGDAQGSQRGLEYDTLSPRYAEFIEKDVLPQVERRASVRLTSDPDQRAAAGCSSGAAAAFTMAWYRNDLYHRVLSYSGTFVNQQWPASPETPGGAWDYHTRLVPSTPRKPIRVWMHVGDRDLLNPNVMRDGMHDWVEANERMAKALAAKGYAHQFVFARNASHCDRAVTAQTLPAALEWLWRPTKVESEGGP